MSKKDLNCLAGIKENIIDTEVFEREIGLCQKLSKDNGGKCGWGKCADCGVVPLLYKLNKGQLLENEEADKIKKEILM